MSSNVPRWIGSTGFVLMLIFCGSFVGGALWFAILLLIPCFALVVLENRYERQTRYEKARVDCLMLPVNLYPLTAAQWLGAMPKDHASFMILIPN